LRLSLSPVVSNGNGGTHKLLGNGQDPCLLDSQNQKGGIIPPGGFHRPPKPPTGITPTVPVKPEVPIGQLPPTGITPTVPVTPEVPIGQLPPTGITPTVPVQPEVPIGQLPPTGITPTVPIKPEVPITPEPLPVVVPDPATLAAVNNAAMATPCAGGRIDNTDLLASGDCNAGQLVEGERFEPYTPGRLLVEPSPWNAWADVSYTNSRDERNNLDIESDTNRLTVGVDHLFDERLAIGVQASINDSESESNSRTIEVDGNGINFGPYLSYGLSEQWSLLFSLDFGVLDRDVRLLNVSGEQEASQYSGSLEFQGQYGLESVLLRPWGLVSYTRSDGDAFALQGDLLGQSVSINLPETQTDGSLVEVGLEASWLHELGNGKRLLPYVEGTVRYTQVDSDSELPLGGNLESTVDDWTGTLRGGVRLLANEATMLELGAGYQSLGQSDLDVWEVFFFVSHGF
jgi:hypothetical protein